MKLRFNRNQYIALPLFETIIHIISPSSGKISTNLEIRMDEGMSNALKLLIEEYNLKIRGIEMTVLAHALSHIDVETEDYLNGYELAVTSIKPSREDILSQYK